MIYLIGVDHIVQYLNDTSNKRIVIEFKDYLRNKCVELGIIMIAEEFSVQALKMNHTEFCTAREVAKELNLEHRFCDPDYTEREKLGISKKQILKRLGIDKTATEEESKRIKEEERKTHPIREKYWYDKINDRIGAEIVFICGDDHIDSFDELLQQNKLETSILSMGWGKNN